MWTKIHRACWYPSPDKFAMQSTFLRQICWLPDMCTCTYFSLDLGAACPLASPIVYYSCLQYSIYDDMMWRGFLKSKIPLRRIGIRMFLLWRHLSHHFQSCSLPNHRNTSPIKSENRKRDICQKDTNSWTSSYLQTYHFAYHTYHFTYHKIPFEAYPLTSRCFVLPEVPFAPIIFASLWLIIVVIYLPQQNQQEEQ